jgi:hypothetical protein
VIGAPFLAFFFAAKVVATPFSGETFVFRCEARETGREVPCRVCLVPGEAKGELPCTPANEPLFAAAGRYAPRVFADGLTLAGGEAVDARPLRGARPRASTLLLDPGGEVATASAPPGATSLEIVHLVSGRRDRAALPRDTRIPMPEGEVVSLAWKGEELLAISRPARVTPGASIAPSFEAPAARSGHLLVRVEDPPGEAPAPIEGRVVLKGAGAEPAGRPPDAHTERFSVFYDVPPGRWTGELQSERWSSEAVPIEVRPGGAAAATLAPLRPRPTLTVDLALDPTVADAPRRLALHRCAPGEWASSGRLDPERCPAAGASKETRAVFRALEAQWHVLELEIGGRRLRRAIDLRPGTDLEERFAIEATRLSGRVLRGRRGIPADVELECLESPGEVISVRAAADGTYRAALWPQGSWRAEVRPDRMERGDAALFPLDAPKPGPLARSFELPPTEVRLSLLDAKTGEPVPSASVAFLAFGKPRWRAAGDSGEVRLSALPPGSLEFHAEAEGYRTRQAAVEIEDSPALQSFELALSPLDPENEFQAVLASGHAAFSARVFVGAAATGLERERVECDGIGICRLAERPSETEGMVLAHPDGGFTVLSAGEALAARRVRLSPAGGILRIAPRRTDALSDTLLQVSVSIPGATLPPVWLDNLAYAIGRPSRTAVFPGARSGFFLSGLPAGPVAVTITAAHRDESGAFGAPSVVAGPLALELPLENAVEVELP